MAENDAFSDFAEYNSRDFLASIRWQMAQWTIFRGDQDESPQGQEVAEHATKILTGMRAVLEAHESTDDGSGILK